MRHYRLQQLWLVGYPALEQQIPLVARQVAATALMAVFFAWLIGAPQLLWLVALPIGFWSAIKANSWFDKTMTVFVFIGSAG